METFIIEGGHRLSGDVTPAGNKNAALPLLAAVLLTEDEVVLRNVPRIGDVGTMLQLLNDMGVSVKGNTPGKPLWVYAHLVWATGSSKEAPVASPDAGLAGKRTSFSSHGSPKNIGSR